LSRTLSRNPNGNPRTNIHATVTALAIQRRGCTAQVYVPCEQQFGGGPWRTYVRFVARLQGWRKKGKKEEGSLRLLRAIGRQRERERERGKERNRNIGYRRFSCCNSPSAAPVAAHSRSRRYIREMVAITWTEKQVDKEERRQTVTKSPINRGPTGWRDSDDSLEATCHVCISTHVYTRVATRARGRVCVCDVFTPS